MKTTFVIYRLVNRNDIIGAWCFEVLQSTVVQALKWFRKQCLDKGYSHCHSVFTLAQMLCDVPDEVSEWDVRVTCKNVWIKQKFLLA